MNPALLNILEESLSITNKLLSLMETDKEDMRGCINGDILKEYQKVSDENIKIVKNIQNTLIVLQDRQTLGM